MSVKLGAFLVEIRTKLKISQTELGKLIGLSRNQIYLYEKGESEADLALVERVSLSLNQDLSGLFTLKNPEAMVREPTEEEIIQRIRQAFQAERELKVLKKKE